MIPAILASSLLTTGSAMAQEAPAAVAPPDVVQTKDGSMYRGTILERVAGDHVDLLLPNGQTRRFAAADVTYSGPPGGAPGVTAPPPAPAAAPAPTENPAVGVYADKVRVKLEANLPNLEYQLQTGSANFVGVGWSGRSTTVMSGVAHAYSSICTAPCEASLPTGTHRLALSKNGGPAVAAEEGVAITGPSTLDATYTDRSGTRIAGLVIGLGGVVAGTVVMVTARTTEKDCSGGSSYCYDSPKLDMTQFWLGAGLMTVAVLVGTVMMFQRDGVEIRVLPATVGAGSLIGRKEAGIVAPNGVALQARF